MLFSIYVGLLRLGMTIFISNIECFNIFTWLFSYFRQKLRPSSRKWSFFWGKKSVRGGDGITIPSHTIQEHTLSYHLIHYHTLHYNNIHFHPIHYHTMNYPLILYYTIHHYTPPNMENVRQKNVAHPIHYHTIFHHTHHNTTAIPNLESVREQKGSLRSVLHASNIGHPQGSHGLQ